MREGIYISQSEVSEAHALHLHGLSRITIAIMRILNADREQDPSDTINEERGSFSPVKKTGMLMKKPPTAHTRLMDDFCRYLLLLKQRKVTERRWVSRVHDNWASYKGLAFLRRGGRARIAGAPSFPAIMIRKKAITASPLVPSPHLLLITRQSPTLIARCVYVWTFVHQTSHASQVRDFEIM